jgi:acetyl-CoA acetyltransferase
LPKTKNDLAVEAIFAALDDAGLTVDDIDGFAYYSGGGFDTGWFAQTLGIPTIRFSAAITSGGNGSAASVALAAAGVESGQANVVVSLMALQQTPANRFGAAGARRASTAEGDFENPFAVFAPGNYFALVAQRHMYEYGTTREHLFEVVSTQRQNALTRPKALFKTPITHDDYFNARMISDPLCLFDFTMENDGAAAVITTSAERARDLRQTPAYIMATAMGGDGRWGRGMSWIGMDDDLFPTAGVGALATELYGRAGITPDDVDVAEFYDHFSPTILVQLEDFGFCGRGESGPFVAEGNMRIGGKIPVNTHGGNLSEAYIIGMTHVVEAVEQVRGTAINQVPGVEVALATGGPSHIPVGAILLNK